MTVAGIFDRLSTNVCMCLPMGYQDWKINSASSFGGRVNDATISDIGHKFSQKTKEQKH